MSRSAVRQRSPHRNPAVAPSPPRDLHGEPLVRQTIGRRQAALSSALTGMTDGAGTLADMAGIIANALQARRKVLVAGNGGSAAEAQHVAAELVGRFLLDRQPFAALALTVDSSVLTAISNDYSFDDVFARQVLGLGLPGDVLLLYSTSGESENVVRAATAGERIGMHVLAVTGDAPSRLGRAAGLTFKVPATETPIVQELQMLVTHLLCEVVERSLCAGPNEVTR